MNKILILCVFFVSSAGLMFSQALTVDDVFKLLDENFEKYPYVHQIEAARTDDSRATSVKITRLPYTYELDEVGNVVKGEKVYITIIRGGYRYQMVFDFLPRREGQSARSEDIKNRTYGGLLSDLRPKRQAAAQEQSGDTASTGN
ncbi:MAG: hypothetical protein LBT01_04500 [Spirochaetaceae bacterium]|jgi:hypothetical protein|nr:hypothetical protein [Spirochaetaceae bacterium]